MRVSRSAILLGGMAATLFSPSPAQSQALTSLHVGMIPIEPAALVYYAKDMGFFDKAGLNVTIEANPSTPALASAVASGSIDISYATIPTLAVAHTKNIPFVIVAPGVSDSATHFGGGIMVAQNSTLRTGKDFNGKTFGCAGLNTIAEYLPRNWIDKTGGDSSTVKFIEMPFSETAEALAAGRIDAGYMSEPFVTLAERRKLAKLIPGTDDAMGPEYIATGWFTTSQWAHNNADTVTRFATAMHNAAIWANAHQTLTIPMAAKYLKSDPALTAQTRRPHYAEVLLPAQVQPYIDVTARYAKFAPFPASELIYVPGK
jgi:NitT/TauT family transport system substrate-binding protein